MNEYVDVDIIENGKVIGTTKVLHVTKEPETQNIKLEKVDAKTAYDNLLIKYAELGKEVRLLGERCNQLLKDKGELTDRCDNLEEENNKLLDVINNQDVKIADLEKENAELKEKYNRVDLIGYDALKNLTEAKEIIRELLSWERRADYDYAEYGSIKDKAEQFLKDVSET